MVLLASFFGCRLVWGTWNSICVFRDVWEILHIDTAQTVRQGVNVTSGAGRSVFSARDGAVCMGKAECVAAQAEVMDFVGLQPSVPWWIIAVYLVSNVTLNALNFYWFGKMVDTVRKRFEGKPSDEFKREKEHVQQGQGVERRKSVIEHAADSLDADVLSGAKTPAVEVKDPMAMSSGVNVNVHGGPDVGKRRKDL